MKSKAKPKITSEVLQQAATRYLGRYLATQAQLRRVLVRKVDKTLNQPCNDEPQTHHC